MRFGLVLLAVVIAMSACGGRGSSGPAWPKPSARSEDGGESLAPKSPSMVAAKKGDEEIEVIEVKPVEATAATPTPTTATPTPTVTTPVITAPDDVIIINDIVIEIDD